MCVCVPCHESLASSTIEAQLKLALLNPPIHMDAEIHARVGSASQRKETHAAAGSMILRPAYDCSSRDTLDGAALYKESPF